MEVKWEDGFKISVHADGNIATISANKAGLLSLAQQLTALAEHDGRDHYHLDEHNSLEDGSSELIIEKID